MADKPSIDLDTAKSLKLQQRFARFRRNNAGDSQPENHQQRPQDGDQTRKNVSTRQR